MSSIYHKLAAATGSAVASLAMIGGGEALAFTNGSSPIIEDAAVGQTLQNGDFLITRFGVVNDGVVSSFARNENLGNGIDETTSWLFDLSGHENFDAFVNSTADITEANLTLELVPTDPEIITDRIGIPFIGNSERKIAKLEAFGVQDGDLVVGESGTITLNLLSSDVFTSEQIMRALTSTEDHTSPWTTIDGQRQRLENAYGGIPFIYHDDAGVVEATLQLIKSDGLSLDTDPPVKSPAAVPEPSAIAGLAVVGLGLLLNKTKKS